MKRASLLRDLPRDEAEPAPRASWYTPGVSDGLGDRLLMFDNTTASSLELLRFRPEFGDAPGFALALRDRLEQLRGLSHPSLATVRAVEWLGDGEGLALVSNHIAGKRLSDVLSGARGATYAMALLRQLGPALAVLHQQGEDIAHGALTPDRIVVTPEGQLVLVEHAIGSALDSLNLPAARLRSELGIVVPYHLDGMALDRRSDVVQLAFVALSLLLGRRLDPQDYPDRIEELLELAAAGSSGFRSAPRLRGWLENALEIGGRRFESAVDAHHALEYVLELHRPRPTTARPEPAITTRRTLLLDGGPPMDEPQPRVDPVVRRPAELVEFRHADAVLPVVDTPPVSVDLPTAPAAMAVVRPRSRGLRWLAVGLGTIAVAEAAVIVALVYMRPSAPGAPLVVTAPLAVGASSTFPTAPVPGTPVAGVVGDAPLQSTPAIPPGPAPASGSTLLAAGQGRLEITSDPAGARVSVDGVRRGVTPLVLAVAPGAHTIVVSDGTTNTSRTLNVTAGGTSTMVAALGPAGAAAGWLSISVPLELQIFEGETLLGSTNARLMLPAGAHELNLVNNATGFQTTLTVEIQPGKVASVSVAVPNGSVSLNALPWANVSIDGKALGTTPVANVDVPLGTHEILWRHPQFGERRQTVVVTAKSPLRLVMDLRK